MDFYLGIDIGTSRVKAVLFDQHFTACASAAENTSPRLSANGYAEQDMTQLWHSVLAILRQIARHPALQAGRLRAIGLAGQGEGVWLSDEQGEPVGPGILWSDTRSHELMSDLLRRPGFDRRYFADTGTHLQPCNTSLQLYWLKQYQPARLAAARYLFFAKDWIRFRLTGVAALELTDASSSLLNQQTGSWSSVVMNEMGLNELLPLFPPLLAPDALAGTLESSDVMVRIGPSSEPGIRLELESLVKQQFGAAIESVVRETLAKLGVERALVSVDDKGALECILRARVQAAALRAAEQAEIQWSAL